MADAMLSAKGDKLYYLSVFEDGYDLWEHNLKENVTKVLLKKVGAGALQPDKEGKNIFLCARDGMKKIEIEAARFLQLNLRLSSITALMVSVNISSTTSGSR